MNKIYVGNLPFNTTEQEVEEVFKQFGDIEEIALIRDRYSNEFKGFGFITFTSQEGAQNALSMDGKEFLGRAIKVNMAREREKRPSGGRGGKGRRW